LSRLSKNDKPWFLTEGKLATILITPSSWGSQWAGHLPRIKLVFWRRCWGGKKTSARGVFRTHILYFVIVLLYFIYFTCIVLYQKPKKLVSFVVVTFVGLLLSCFIMLSINGWFL
jgi:hypothetical protein